MHADLLELVGREEFAPGLRDAEVDAVDVCRKFVRMKSPLLVIRGNSGSTSPPRIPMTAP
jgi:hypothetical protein